MIYVTSAPIADAKNPVYRIQEGRSNLQKKKGEQKIDFEYLKELGSEKKTSLVHSLKL